MKVKDLRKILEEYPDNTDVLIYNGFVEDWQDFTWQETMLEKMKPSEQLKLCNQQHPDRTYTIKQMKSDWNLLNPFGGTDWWKKLHSYKTILLLSPKFRNKRTSDRVGTITY